jgi:pilus assembly protein CpaB
MLRALILVFALLAGGLAAWFAMPKAGDSGVAVLAAAAPPPPSMGVLVAATDLAAGATLTAETLRWQDWPVAAVNAAFITQDAKPDAVVSMAGLVVRTGLVAGEPIYESRLVGAGAGYLSVMLATGRRAIAVRISAENTAGGFILPDDHVDVLHTVSSVDPSGKMQAKSSLILQNVRVLAIDQMTADRQSDSVVGKTATLELNAEQVEAISAAEASGALSLALRAVADNSETSELVTVRPRTVQIFRTGGVEVIHLTPGASETGALSSGGT